MLYLCKDLWVLDWCAMVVLDWCAMVVLDWCAMVVLDWCAMVVLLVVCTVGCGVIHYFHRVDAARYCHYVLFVLLFVVHADFC